MPVEIVTLNWVQERQFVMHDRNRFPILMDQPNGVNAADLLPLSLIGCTAYDVIAILEKQRQDVKELAVTAASTRDPHPPWIFRKIHIHYRIIGHRLDKDKVNRAIHLSEDKYCSIFATLREVIELTSDFELSEG